VASGAGAGVGGAEGEPPRGVCFDLWRTGVCHRGASCLYSHHVMHEELATLENFRYAFVCPATAGTSCFTLI